jgi:site-specific DNA-methyltransferase (adenine-specific)/modification methylase
LEFNKIYNEDCRDTLSRIPDNSIDLIVTSPPYNMRTRIRNGEYTTRETSEHFSKKYNYFGDDLPITDFYDLHKSILIELLRVSKVICYNFQIVTGSKEAFFKIIGDFSSNIKDIIIWDKGHGEPAMHDKILNSCYEFILVLENDNKKGRMIHSSYFNRGTLNNIIRIKKNKSDFKEHKAVFPEELAEKLILNFSKKDDLVYDPFMGSGTTGKMALLNNRNFIGSEISEEYCKIANDRVNSVRNRLF